ncbi:MAG TPA: hypothetical protein VGR61_01840 [Candidatus Dormibacteraeota bacterium]|nr:hypothetical protein [Candidatus Dormibacteraeota bacterium]
MPPIFKAAVVRSWRLLLNVFTTRSTMEFERFTRMPLPTGTGSAAPYTAAGASPAVMNVTSVSAGAVAGENPTLCEETFTELISASRFASAWDLLTPDSQASWQDKESFTREMGARQPGRGLLGSKVREVRMLAQWTDEHTSKTYHEVAELVVDYRVRRQARESIVTQDVHLVNVNGGWKSLCYRT